MQSYRKTKILSVAIVGLLVAAIQPVSPEEIGAQQEPGLFTGRYIPLRWLGGEPGVLKLDPQLRYIGRGVVQGLQVWALSPDLAQGELSYEFQRIRSREVIGAAATKAGLVFIGDYPWPDGAEPAGYKLFLWDPERKELKRLKWGDEFGKNIFTNPDGTELARFRAHHQEWTSNYVDSVEIFDFVGNKIRSITLNKRIGNFFSPTIMDSRNNVYVVAQNHEQTRRFLAVFQSDTQSYEVFKDSELLLEKFQGVGQPQRPIPLLLRDGATVATYAYPAIAGGRYSIQYYREGKLVKSVNDPVPMDAVEARLATTGDGKGVLTQVTGGDKKGLVKVWDIETGKYSEIATLPEVRYVFPWVQGKYAPIWTSPDGQTYKAGVLEITRSD